MKLPSSVLSALRGVGGAAVIAATVVGCGGATRAPTTAGTPEDPGKERLLVSENRNEEPTPPPTEPPPPPIDPDSYPVACGRG